MPYHLSIFDNGELRTINFRIHRDAADAEQQLSASGVECQIYPCTNSLLCDVCREAGFGEEVYWPRRGWDWNLVDQGTHFEIVRATGTTSFNDDDEVAVFILATAMNPGAPRDVRLECKNALGEIRAKFEPTLS
jgi:hypothetical protein